MTSFAKGVIESYDALFVAEAATTMVFKVAMELLSQSLPCEPTRSDPKVHLYPGI